MSLLCFKVSGTEKENHPVRAWSYFPPHKRIHRRLTLEALGSCLSEREKNVTHDSWAAHPRLGDDIEDTVNILPQVLLQ